MISHLTHTTDAVSRLRDIGDSLNSQIRAVRPALAPGMGYSVNSQIRADRAVSRAERG